MTTEAELRVQDVSKSFGGVQAIGQVSLEVRHGEMVSIIGPNGAGKTTLLNMVSGFYHPDGGAIFSMTATLPIWLPAVLPRLVLHAPFRILPCFVA